MFHWVCISVPPCVPSVSETGISLLVILLRIPYGKLPFDLRETGLLRSSEIETCGWEPPPLMSKEFYCIGTSERYIPEETWDLSVLLLKVYRTDLICNAARPFRTWNGTEQVSSIW